MPKHGSRVVEKGDWENKCDFVWIEFGNPGTKLRTRFFRQVFWIEMQFLLQPIITCDKGALRMLFFVVYLARGKETCQGSFQFRLWIAFPIGREKKGFSIYQAFYTRHE